MVLCIIVHSLTDGLGVWVTESLGGSIIWWVDVLAIGSVGQWVGGFLGQRVGGLIVWLVSNLVDGLVHQSVSELNF